MLTESLLPGSVGHSLSVTRSTWIQVSGKARPHLLMAVAASQGEGRGRGHFLCDPPSQCVSLCGWERTEWLAWLSDCRLNLTMPTFSEVEVTALP